MSAMHRYALTTGAVRVGLFLACAILLVHLFVEPRREPVFGALVDALLVLGGCAVIGYVVGLVLWLVRSRMR